MPFFEERFKVVLETLRAASFRYRHGFYTVGSVTLNIPVTFNCRPEMEGLESATHFPQGFITLKDNWFNWTAPSGEMDMRRAMIIIHEMLHWCRNQFIFELGVSFNLVSTLLIQNLWLEDLDDRSDPDCVGYPGDKCYQWTSLDEYDGPPIEPHPANQPFIGDTLGRYMPFFHALSNPGKLVDNFNQQVDGDAKYKMLGNVDNFMSYLWNRWIDHGYCRLSYWAPLG